MEPMVDERGNKHYILEKIGTDGQGTLYATKNSDIIIRDSESDNALLYENIKFLPISGIEKLLLPVDYLEAPNIGYVLNIPEGFVPLSSISDLKTIGYKRRLGLLADITKVLVKLHALPVMYGSMSFARILISSKAQGPQASEAYLLYSAKMDFAMGFIEEMDADPYIAPEAQRGLGGTIASDSYSFGALANDLLNGEPMVQGFQELYERSQGDPPARPKISEFYRFFLQQLDLMLSCKKCHADFHYSVKECPGCEAAPPKMLKADIYDNIDGNKITRGFKVLEFASNRQCFWNYHTDNVLLDDKIEPRIDCVLNLSGDRKLHLIFKNLMDKEIIINEKKVPAGQGTVVALPCEMIRIRFKLYSATERYIDMVMV